MSLSELPLMSLSVQAVALPDPHTALPHQVAEVSERSGTPVARIARARANRRKARTLVSPSPMVLQPASRKSFGALKIKISEERFGPSKRKLHMSPYARLDSLDGTSERVRQRITRRRVSVSGRRNSGLIQVHKENDSICSGEQEDISISFRSNHRR